MKKIIIMYLMVLLLAFSLIGMSACENASNNQEKETNEILLTLENYEYYLTITSQLTGSGSYAGGTYRYATSNVYITGAVNGIYQDCRLYLKSGAVIELNVAGCAQTQRSVVNGEDSFIVVKVEGKIVR